MNKPGPISLAVALPWVRRGEGAAPSEADPQAADALTFRSFLERRLAAAERAASRHDDPEAEAEVVICRRLIEAPVGERDAVTSLYMEAYGAQLDTWSRRAARTLWHCWYLAHGFRAVETNSNSGS